MRLSYTHRHITSTKTTSDTKKGNIYDLPFLIVVVFHQDGNQPKEPVGSAPWLNQTSQFISVIQMPSYIVSLNFWPMYPNKLLQHCWFLKNPDRWRAKTDSPPFAPIHPFFLASLGPTRSAFLCTHFDQDSHLKRTSIRKCRHFLFLLRIKVGFEWMSTYSFWAAREITSMFLVFDFLRSGVFLSKLWEAICV